MRVLVAGASGAIGRSLVPRLVAAGHDVTATTRSERRAEMIRAAGARAAICDALDADALRRAAVDAAPDVVAHELTALPTRLDPRDKRAYGGNQPDPPRQDRQPARRRPRRRRARSPAPCASSEGSWRRIPSWRRCSSGEGSTELLIEPHAAARVDLQRVALTAAAIQHQHRQADQPLARRILGRKLLELGDDERVLPVGQTPPRCAPPKRRRATPQLGDLACANDSNPHRPAPAHAAAPARRRAVAAPPPCHPSPAPPAPHRQAPQSAARRSCRPRPRADNPTPPSPTPNRQRQASAANATPSPAGCA